MTAKRGNSAVWRSRLDRWDVKSAPYIFIAPFFIVFLVVGAIPLAYTAWVGLRDWDLIGGDGGFVGLANFSAVLARPVFWVALVNTISIFLLSVIPQLILATLVAASLATNIRAQTFWRMGILLPFVVAPVAVSLIFGDLFGDRYGFVNSVLQTFGLTGVEWHVERIPSHIAIASMVMFRWTGYNALILLAAMLAIPKEYYDAASIDGANKWRMFFSITLPLIRPTMIFVVITATIGGLQIFDEPRLFSRGGGGGSNNQWLTLTMYLYDIGWSQRDFGRASAIAWILFLLIIVIAMLNFLITRRLASIDDNRTARPRSMTSAKPVGVTSPEGRER